MAAAGSCTESRAHGTQRSGVGIRGIITSFLLPPHRVTIDPFTGHPVPTEKCSHLSVSWICRIMRFKRSTHAYATQKSETLHSWTMHARELLPRNLITRLNDVIVKGRNNTTYPTDILQHIEVDDRRTGGCGSDGGRRVLHSVQHTQHVVKQLRQTAASACDRKIVTTRNAPQRRMLNLLANPDSSFRWISYAPSAYLCSVRRVLL